MSVEKTAITFRLECWRALSSGILETAAHTFLLLIALTYFEAGAIAKALVAGGGSLGLLISPLIVSTIEKLHWKTARGASFLFAIGAVCCLLMALIPSLPVFVIGSILSMTTSSAAIPLITQIYQENYPAAQRGRRFSRTILIRIATAAIFSDLAGRILDWNIEWYKLLLLIFSGAFVFASICLSRYPSTHLAASASSHPLRSLALLKTDRLFAWTLIAWMFMGFANLMMFPMRVEYLANPVYGLSLSKYWIAMIVGVAPAIARLIMTSAWGWLFDHMNFFLLRIILNMSFAVGIGIFFHSQHLYSLIIGAAIFGLALSGGEVAWNLWVTKLAPPSRVADYMSVHTFLTGTRGFLAPLIGFLSVAVIPIQALALISIALILIASLMMLPTIKHGRTPRHHGSLSEDS